MINTNDEVKFVGTVKSTGTGTFTVAIEEFFVDNVWHKFIEAKELEINEADFNNELTTLELECVKELAQDKTTDTTLCDDKVAVINSIIKKLNKDTAV